MRIGRAQVGAAAASVLAVAGLVCATVPSAGAAPLAGRHGHGLTEPAKLPAPPRPPQQPVHKTVTVPPSAVPHAAAPAVSSGAAAVQPDTFTSSSGAVTTTQLTTAATGAGALVLYDTTNTYGWLGELYAEQTANLASHFGSYKTEPVTSYTAGQMANYAAVIYVGSTYDEPIPAAFLSDVLATTEPVIWAGDNIWQLTNADPTFSTDYGWNWTGFDFSTVNAVSYKGQTLARDGADNQGGILNLAVSDPSKATVLAQAVRADGSTFPWATRAKNLTYIGEVPYSYEGMNDRYLAAADLLFDGLAPATTARHRALVRLEDVNPNTDPADLKKAADVLSANHVPFTIAVFPLYLDPKGYYNNGTPVTMHMKDAPAVVSAIKYAMNKGGSLVEEGYTHQYSNIADPYNGVSADDCEFYLAHVDSSNTVVFDGPVPVDSASWAQNRVTSAAAEFKAAGLPVPSMWMMPHYVASALDYQTIGKTFTTRYDRTLYFGGQLSGGPVDYGHMNGQFFPYKVTDLYGSKVVPENIGDDEPQPYNANPARHPADIIASAQANLAVRDGFASFFFDPYLMSDTADGTTKDLQTIVTGIKNLGYTFVASGSV